MSIEPSFYSDRDVAHLLALSPSWVRVQRHKRRKGQPHFLAIDPHYIGRSPRYLKSEVLDFVSNFVSSGETL